jgi:hypothetical protein
MIGHWGLGHKKKYVDGKETKKLANSRTREETLCNQGTGAVRVRCGGAPNLKTTSFALPSAPITGDDGQPPRNLRAQPCKDSEEDDFDPIEPFPSNVTLTQTLVRRSQPGFTPSSARSHVGVIPAVIFLGHFYTVSPGFSRLFGSTLHLMTAHESFPASSDLRVRLSTVTAQMHDAFLLAAY